jgi:hypothetical protein
MIAFKRFNAVYNKKLVHEVVERKMKMAAAIFSDLH